MWSGGKSSYKDMSVLCRREDDLPTVFARPELGTRSSLQSINISLVSMQLLIKF